MENKIFAVKRNNYKWWAAIDCGTTQKGGMAVDNYWLTHFEKEGKTYRWYAEIFMPPSDLQEWSEIKVIDKSITIIADDGILFDGWEDRENAAYETLQKFAKLLGKNLTINEIKMLINGE